MPSIVYPPALPGPSAFPFARRDPRASPAQEGLPQHRQRSRELIVDVKGVRWRYTPAEMEIWRPWWKDTLLDGQLWFAMTLPGPGGWLPRVARYVSSSKREHLAAGIYEVSADLEINGSRVPPVAYGPSFVVDLDATVHAGLDATAGVVVSGLDPARNYLLSMELGGAFVAWDSNAGGGGAWLNRFRVTTTAGTSTYGAGTGSYVTPELARSHFEPVTISGFDTYTFWLSDNVPEDNEGGLSITVTPA